MVGKRHCRVLRLCNLSLGRIKTKETGFLPFLRAIIHDLEKKPVSNHPSIISDNKCSFPRTIPLQLPPVKSQTIRRLIAFEYPVYEQMDKLAN